MRNIISPHHWIHHPRRVSSGSLRALHFNKFLRTTTTPAHLRLSYISRSMYLQPYAPSTRSRHKSRQLYSLSCNAHARLAHAHLSGDRWGFWTQRPVSRDPGRRAPEALPQLSCKKIKNQSQLPKLVVIEEKNMSRGDHRRRHK